LGEDVEKREGEKEKDVARADAVVSRGFQFQIRTILINRRRLCAIFTFSSHAEVAFGRSLSVTTAQFW
jgi:hypothetical protein